MNYKLFGIYNVEEDGNKIMSADKILFEISDSVDKCVEFYKEHLQNSSYPKNDFTYCVVKTDENGTPIEAECRIFDFEEDGVFFIDGCDWDTRVLLSVALECDLI